MRKVYSLLSESGDSSGSGNFYGWVTWKENNPFSGERKYRCNYVGDIKKGDSVTLYSRHDKRKIYKGSVTEIERHSSTSVKKEKNDDITLTIKPDNSFKKLGIFNDVALISNANNIEYTNNIKCKFSGFNGFIEYLKSHDSYIYLIPLTEHVGSHSYEFRYFYGKIKEPRYTTDNDGIAKGTISINLSSFCPVNKGMKFMITNHRGNRITGRDMVSYFVMREFTIASKGLSALAGGGGKPAFILICEVI